ncbi:MAG TPA: 2OG-Fe(II) oxygenase [Sphingomicrobium sp.]|nr:2OG-Fe(II) oxygenase [Sphingomicrobium sp.]
MERARNRLRPATVVTRSGSQTVEGGRTNRAIEFQIADMDLVIEIVRARISAAARLPLPLFETSQVLHYAPGQEFTAHHDYFDPDNSGHAEELQRGQRIATFLIYLNDSYTLGETAFPRAQLSFRGNVGDALFITNVERSGRPDPMTLHAGTPPGSGEKWIFSQWIRDKPPTA